MVGQWGRHSGRGCPGEGEIEGEGDGDGEVRPGATGGRARSRGAAAWCRSWVRGVRRVGGGRPIDVRYGAMGVR